MMVSARQPLQPQQQLQQQNQTSGNLKANDSFLQNIQDQINHLSDSDKQLLQNVAQSTVNDILSQNQGSINESDLEDAIVQKHNVSSDIADLVVKVLKVVNNGAFAKQIILNTSSNDNIDNNPIFSQTAAFQTRSNSNKQQGGALIMIPMIVTMVVMRRRERMQNGVRSIYIFLALV